MEQVAVLFPAAGAGTRMGGARKQFRTLGGAPVLVQTLKVFDRHPRITHLIVAAPEEAVASLHASLQAAGVRKLTAVVAGGTSRQASVACALQAVPAAVEVVLVHDAVRPFVPHAKLDALLAAIAAHGAAALAVPVADTLRAASAGHFAQTIPREGLYRMQTPQGSRRDWLATAHAQATHAEATDDVELLQQAGFPVHYVEGSPYNFKITTPDDWAMAQRLWPLSEEAH